MSDEELIERLRKADEYEPLGHDGWEAADRIEALVKARREDALELLAAHGQAQEAYEAQLKAEARAEQLAATNERLEAAAAAVADDVCSYICPSVGKAGAPIPHDPCCIALRAALKGADHE